jgi:hypothetical protein
MPVSRQNPRRHCDGVLSGTSATKPLNVSATVKRSLFKSEQIHSESKRRF